MRIEKNIKQVQLEPDYYFNIGFPFDLSDVEKDFLREGYHLGQFASVKKINDGLFRSVRDPLGIGKLFYTETPEGELHFSEKFIDLFSYKNPIYSVPAGSVVDIGSGGRRELVRNLGVSQGEYEYKSFDFQNRFKHRLEAVFSMFRNFEDEGWSFFIALSGGLDSTIIASKAAEYLKKPIACTLDLGKSEDSEKSKKIAKHLGIKHMVFSTDEEETLQALNEAPVLCQDFRDFNVHCAALNILLGKNIKQYIETNEEINKEKVIILTGDLMNEYTCDYTGEIIDGVEYYKLPRVDKKELQNYLISGLDTSDREISVFNAFGLYCIQPYAALYDLYASLPESVLTVEDPKKMLNSFLVDSELLSFVPKIKLRAQVGSRENMGILGLCHRKGFNDKTFYKKLIEGAGNKDLQVPIFVGRYDVEKFD